MLHDTTPSDHRFYLLFPCLTVVFNVTTGCAFLDGLCVVLWWHIASPVVVCSITYSIKLIVFWYQPLKTSEICIASSKVDRWKTCFPERFDMLYGYSQSGASASRRIYQLTLLYPTGTFHLYRRPIGAGSPFFSYSASRAAWSFTQAGSGRCDICKFWAKDFSVRAQVVFEVKRSGSISLSPCIAKLYPGEPPRINLLGSISTGRLSELIPYWRAYFIFVWYN